MKSKSYRQLILLPTFKERFEYLKLTGKPGEMTFGFDRYMNQKFYTSNEWKNFRNKVIARDDGNDLGHPDFPIGGRIIIHHINPLVIDDFANQTEALFDMDNVICVSNITHEAIHFGDASLLPQEPVERKPGDTKLW